MIVDGAASALMTNSRHQRRLHLSIVRLLTQSLERVKADLALERRRVHIHISGIHRNMQRASNLCAKAKWNEHKTRSRKPQVGINEWRKSNGQ